MPKDKSKYNIEESQKNISENLRQLMNKYNYNQKQFSNILGVSESTFSGYMNGSKPPNISFMISLKNRYPDLSIDDFLFTRNLTQETNTTLSQNSISNNDYRKYYGSYLLFYLDTNKRIYSKPEDNAYETTDLRAGILHISNNPSKESAAKCVAVLGIKRRDEAEKLKNHLDSIADFDEVSKHLQNNYSYSLYCGEFNISQMHIFISLTRWNDSKNNALIILHHTSINKEHYLGGLGTINSVSTGRSSDPIVQKIAISRYNPSISEEHIKARLRFKSPNILLRSQAEAKEIIRLAESLHTSNNDCDEPTNSQINLNLENRKTLLYSILEALITKNIDNNCLWYGRVSSSNDDDWYHLIKDVEAYYDKQSQGDEYESFIF